ncbi:hypothetical protein IE077_003544, partial [Cardiosporidium cionae]
KGNAERIYSKGKNKEHLRSRVAQNVTKNGKTNMNFREVFEYRGSYLDLENEKLKIKVWEYRIWSLNHLEAVFEEPLLNFATGEIFVEKNLYKFVKGHRCKRCRLSFQLCFQELYDFELSFIKWRLRDIKSAGALQQRTERFSEKAPRDDLKSLNVFQRAKDMTLYKLQKNRLNRLNAKLEGMGTTRT